jgi:hypothetical protein
VLPPRKKKQSPEETAKEKAEQQAIQKAFKNTPERDAVVGRRPSRGNGPAD